MMEFACEVCQRKGIEHNDTVMRLREHLRTEHEIHGVEAYSKMGLVRKEVEE
jgi:hypothetical protein